MESGKVYVVGTPIGNLQDMTYRGVDTLKSVDIIACEDTRVTGKLCAHYGIDTQRVAIHHHTKKEKIDDLISRVRGGESLAYVSDAGTPGVSDPGNQVVAAAVEAGVEVVAVPGASALAALLSIAGVNTQTFNFLAYPPHKKGRQTYFAGVAASDVPVVYYDSVHRVVKNLELLGEVAPHAHVVVGRELTKMFEEVRRGSALEIVQYFQENPSKVKGEFVLLVVPNP